jgi:hypothetical protein
LAQKNFLCADGKQLEDFNVDIRGSRRQIMIGAACLEVGTTFFCETIKQFTIGVATSGIAFS